jgi:hypothetical protein
MFFWDAADAADRERSTVLDVHSIRLPREARHSIDMSLVRGELEAPSGKTEPEGISEARRLNDLALKYQHEGRYAGAEPLYRRSLTMLEAKLGPHHPAIAASLGNLAALYQEEGRYAEAKSAAEAMEKRLLPHAQMMPVLEVFLWTPIWVDLRFAKWDSILERPEPLADRAVSHLMWRYSRTLAYLAHKDIAKAQSERELFSKEASTLPPQAAFAEMNPPAAVLSVANEVIVARLEEAQGNADAGRMAWAGNQLACRNCHGARMVNGIMCPHCGSMAGWFPAARVASGMGGLAGTGFGCGRHCPGWVPGVYATCAVAPSAFRSVSMAAAAAWPVAIPSCFARASGIFASAAA